MIEIGGLPSPRGAAPSVDHRHCDRVPVCLSALLPKGAADRQFVKSALPNGLWSFHISVRKITFT